MTIKKFILLLLLCVLTVPAKAVLKDESIDKTVQMFRKELEVFLSKQKEEYDRFQEQRIKFWKNLNRITEQSDEYALVLYSQQGNYLFGTSHACRQLSEIYKEFERERYPFKSWTEDLDHEIQRYTKLEGILSRIQEDDLSEKGKQDRIKAYQICETIKNYLQTRRNLLDQDIAHYDKEAKNMREINEYTESRGAMIRKKIFVDGSESYITTLSNFRERLSTFIASAHEIYFTGQNTSQAWINRTIELIIATIMLLVASIGVCFLFFRYVLPHIWKNHHWKDKKTYYALSTGFLLYSGLMYLMAYTLFARNFFIIATSILGEFALMMGIILLSVTIRIKVQNIKQTYYLYAPTFILSFIFLVLRISLASNDMMAFILPPLLLINSVIHLFLLIKYSRKADRTDSFYSWTSFLLNCILIVYSWAGFRFLSLQLFMFWTVLMTGIQGIICIRYLLGTTNKGDRSNKQVSIKEVWFDSMVNKLVIPLLLITVIIGSLIWSAHLFDMSAWMIKQLTSYFINKPNVAMISISDIIWLIGLGIVFNYVIYIVKEILRSVYHDKYETGSVPVAVTLGTILAWLIYGITIILTFDINSNGIIAILAGASTGAAFAMKDTFDNFFCGLSLMLGRVRRGDIVECDGYRGKIINLGLHTTNLETTDGSIISFLNSQLFNKNFKNLTRNHGYELNKIPIGIAYGSDVERAKNIIIECVQKTGKADESRGINVFLNNFGDSSVDMLVLVWIQVKQRGVALSAIRTAIYEGLNKSGITIPFPQQDVYLHQADDTPCRETTEIEELKQQ